MIKLNSKPKERTEYIGIRVTPDEKAFIKELAHDCEITMTDVIVEAVYLACGHLIVSHVGASSFAGPDRPRPWPR